MTIFLNWLEDEGLEDLVDELGPDESCDLHRHLGEWLHGQDRESLVDWDSFRPSFDGTLSGCLVLHHHDGIMLYFDT